MDPWQMIMKKKDGKQTSFYIPYTTIQWEYFGFALVVFSCCIESLG